MSQPLRFRVAAGHAPPARAPKARAAFLAQFATVLASVKGGDLNVTRRVVARMTGRRVVGGGVLWLVVNHAKFKVVRRVLVDVGGDHLAVFALLRHRRTGVEVRVLVINCMGASAGYERSATVLRRGMRLNPDVILGVEGSDIRATLIDADRHGIPAYYWHQPGSIGSPESGSLIGVSRKFGDLDRRRSRVGSKATNEGANTVHGHGRGIRERSIVTGRITTKEKA